jgi:hypothetical protein
MECYSVPARTAENCVQKFICHHVKCDMFCAEVHENPTNNSNADNRKRSDRQTETENRKNGRVWSPQNASSSTS